MMASSDNEQNASAADEDDEHSEEVEEEDEDDENDVEQDGEDESDKVLTTVDTGDMDDKHENARQRDNDEDEEDDEDDHEDDDEDNGNDDGPSNDLMVGGTIAVEAYALITGVFFPNIEIQSEREVLSIPITRLPATLGRSHETKDRNFFGLGNKKVLSRQQAKLYYRDIDGGILYQKLGSHKLSYQPPEKGIKQPTVITKLKNLPKTGFFVIECLGKNRIFVDGQRVEQGEVALMESGSTIKLNSYNLLFLLPENAPKTTMPLPGSALPPKKKSASGRPAPHVEKLEATPIAELLDNFFKAIEDNQWERRHQMMGGAITLHACKDAARSKVIQKIASQEDGVSRSEVMDWIANSKRYGKWSVAILNKMEVKSYQANVTKCLWKAGYRRNAPVGRFVRWNLPSEEEIGPGEPMDEDDDDDDDGNANARTKSNDTEEEDDDDDDDAPADDDDEDEDNNDNSDDGNENNDGSDNDGDDNEDDNSDEDDNDDDDDGNNAVEPNQKRLRLSEEEDEESDEGDSNMEDSR